MSRDPNEEELAELSKLLGDARAYYRDHVEQAAEAIKLHPVEGMEAAENAAWVVTLRVVLNLDEFIVRE